jgi:hypothetical protein
MARSDDFRLLRGVLNEQVHEYRWQVETHGLAAARQALVPAMEALAERDPGTAARLIAAALDLLAEQAEAQPEET